LKKFIGGDSDSKIEIVMEIWSKHRGPRLSIEVGQRLEFAEDLSE